MIYVIVTTSLIEKDFEIRKAQYIKGINSLLEVTKNKNYEIVIVENNGKRKTFLDEFGLKIFYTENNKIASNKGINEWNDIQSCIREFRIDDDDFIIKMTGRYFLNIPNAFFDMVDKDFDCIIKYGSYMRPLNKKCMDCITGLIGMKCKFMKNISCPKQSECVEWKFAQVTYSMSDEKICILNNLDINIAPNSNSFFCI